MSSERENCHPTMTRGTAMPREGRCLRGACSRHHALHQWGHEPPWHVAGARLPQPVAEKEELERGANSRLCTTPRCNIPLQLNQEEIC